MSTEKQRQEWRDRAKTKYQKVKNSPLRLKNKRLAALKYYYNHKDKIQKKAKERRHLDLLKRHKLKLVEYNKILQEQNFKCAICIGEITKNFKSNLPLCIDHNHKTLEVRGLLCNRCNAFIGLAKENINTLKQAIKYLERKKNVKI